MLETSIFKNTSVSYDAIYFYCDEAEKLYADEFQMHENDRAMKDAKNELPLASYQKYFKRAACLYEKSEDLYMRKALEARYIRNKSSI